MRADQLLVERGLAASRSQAVRLIAGGLRWRDGGDWRVVAKNRDDIPADAELELQDDAEARYVSRGGLKLEGALAATGIEARGLRCLDVGQSTGGFTDCLLQQGAAQVIGVDVGHGQLHARIRGDARVIAIEGVNARSLTAAAWRGSEVQGADADAAADADADADPDADGGTAAASSDPGFGLIVGDLSFISLTLVLPALLPLLAPGGQLLLLVKPQFELQPGQIGKGGLVRDPALHALVEQRLRDACEALGLRLAHWLPSPIAGGDGNREFFIHALAHEDEPGAGRAPSAQL